MRKKKAEAHVNHERWLVSYADFITLLFAFFVVMFAISKVDAQKLGRFVESVNVAFEYRGIFAAASPNLVEGGGYSAPLSGRPSIVPPKYQILPTSQKGRRTSDIHKAIGDVMLHSALNGKVKMRLDSRGVTVSLSEAGFFDPGSAKVRTGSVSTLRQIAEILRESEAPIVVEGHTDNIPIRTALYPSNWELSTARATSIVTYLIEEMRYDPARLAVAGYGEYRPVADNSTPEGRALNRRVDLVVLSEGSGGPPPR